jgi:hypothetical protein
MTSGSKDSDVFSEGYIKPERAPKKHERVRNKKKKQKFNGVEVSLHPRHQPYNRMRAQALSRLIESEDERCYRARENS